MKSDHNTPAVAVTSLRKQYGATVAVNDVSFRIEPGKVHALLGENGAGKSTIVKLLSGLIGPDKGDISIFGKTCQMLSPRDAHTNGIQTAFQEMTLVPDLTVLDNMLLPYAPVNYTGIIRRRSAKRQVREHLDAMEFDVDLNDEVGKLDLALQQKIEIARAIFRKPRILLLDEPTSTLAGRDVDWLESVVARLKANGVTVVFISHRMPEVRSFCDNLTIMRNGQHISTGAVSDYDDAQIVEMIIGRSISQTFPARPDKSMSQSPEVLSVNNLTAGAKLKQANFSLQKGEILGVGGLQGMGQLDLFMALYGMRDIYEGGICVDGKPVTITSPRDAIRPNIAMGLLPEDRKTEALFLKLPGLHNVSLPVIDRYGRGGILDAVAERKAVNSAFDRVNVDQRALWMSAGAFSGGNQQKIAIAKWLFAESRILLLFDPTRGIDVGTKHELYVLMREFTGLGGSILFHSTEIPEIVHLCDRAIVLYSGRVAAELNADELSENSIMRAALGADAQVLGAMQ